MAAALSEGRCAASNSRRAEPGTLRKAREPKRALAAPAFEVGGNEGVVVELGVGRGNAVDAGRLAGAEDLPRVEAVRSRKQALPPQHLVAAGDAAGKAVGDVENDAIAVGYHRIDGQKIVRDNTGADAGMCARQQLDGSFGPHAPVPQQPALEADLNLALSGADPERRDEIGDDMVVVAGVERDAILRAGGNDTEGDVQRLVAIERGHLDGNHVIDASKARPKPARQGDTADGGLEIKADHGQLARNAAAVFDELIFAGTAQASKPQ